MNLILTTRTENKDTSSIVIGTLTKTSTNHNHSYKVLFLTLPWRLNAVPIKASYKRFIFVISVSKY